MTYNLIVPIEMGTEGKTGHKIIEELNLHKPNLGELCKINGGGGQYSNALGHLIACSDQPKVVLQRLDFEDTKELMENVLPDFLGMGGE